MFNIVMAGAGCGKTTFIIKKVKELLNNKKTSKKILIITYTNSCVDEIRQRLKNISNNVIVSTFHGICHQKIKSNKVFSEDNNLSILSSYLNLEISNDFYNYYNIMLNYWPIEKKDYFYTLEKFFHGKKDTNINEKNLGDFFRDDCYMRIRKPINILNKKNWEENLITVKKHFNYLNTIYNKKYFNYFTNIEDTRKILNTYTFSHMILEVIDNIHEFTMNIWQEFDHIFIDEIQDLSAMQLKIIEHIVYEMIFLEEKKSVTIVGDRNQSIFSFQGANSKSFDNFLQKIKNIPSLLINNITLNSTYRFSGQLLEFVNKYFFKHVSHNSLTHNTKIYLLPFVKNNEDFIAQICKILEDIFLKEKKKKILVLYYARSSIVNLIEEFVQDYLYKKEEEKKIKEKINIISNKKFSIYNKFLDDFFNLISFILTREEIYFVKFITGGMIFIEEPDFYNLCKKREENIYDEIKKKYGYLNEIIEIEYLCNVKFLGDFLSFFEKSQLFKNYYSYYGKDVLIFFEHLCYINNSYNNISIYAFLQLENISLYMENNYKDTSNIIINFSTIHNAKGTQADHVIILDANDIMYNNNILIKDSVPVCYFFKTEQNLNNEEEFKNLCYVAVTRAKYNLYVCGGFSTKKNKDTIYDYVDIFLNS